MNAKGYLIDKVGNVIDRKGNWILDKDVLDEEGEIPKVFRKGLLRKDSTEDLKGIWAMIENDKKKAELNDIDEEIDESDDEWLIEEELWNMKKGRWSGDETSEPSRMGENPKKYNKQNKRRWNKQGKYHKNCNDSDLEAIDEKGIKWKKKKKGKKGDPQEELLGVISYRDYLLAKAYGGEPKVTTLSNGSGSRASSWAHSRFKSISKLKNKAKNNLGALSFAVTGFNEDWPNSKGSKRKFDLVSKFGKSWWGAKTNINEEDSEYSVALNQLHEKYENP